MTVIAMTREMGTRGKDVAAKLAEKLGVEVVHHELVEKHLAERLQADESAVHRFLEGEASLWQRWRIDSKRLSRFTAEEILELAARGGVLIRGWGAAQLLRDVPHVICVRVCAPTSRRIEEMKQRLGVAQDDFVRREIERNDAAHDRAVQGLLSADWRDPTSYDLVINTGSVSVDAAVALIEDLARRPEHQPSEQSRQILKDRLLTARIRTVFDELLERSPDSGGLEIGVGAGHVTLSGAVVSKVRVREFLSAIEKLDGVTSVTDETIELKTPAAYYS